MTRAPIDATPGPDRRTRGRSGVAVLCLGAVACAPAAPDESIGRASAAATVESLAALNVRRGSAPCVTLGSGDVLLAGSNIPGGWLGSAEVYSAADGVWRLVGDLALPRGDHATVRLPDGSALVHGGGDDVATLHSAERYDPASQRWLPAASSATMRTGHRLTLLADGRVLLTGGVGEDFVSPLRTTELYSPATDTWAPGPDMPNAHGRHATVRLPDGRVMVAGNPAITVAEVLSADATRWTSTGPLATPRESPALGVLPDGRVVIAGGRDGAMQGITSVELWDPATNSWSAGPPTAEAHAFTELVPLPSGALVLAASDNYGGTAVEVLDGAATGWTTVGFLRESRWGYCAVGFPRGALWAGSVIGADLQTTEGYILDGEGASCSSGDTCQSGACSGGRCTAPPPIGVDAGTDAGSDGGGTAPDAGGATVGDFERCTADRECASGHCVDGVCCDTPCTELCHSCVIPWAPGRCTAAPLGVDLRGECGAAATCSGTCGGDGTCVGATAGTQCAPAQCTSTSTGVGPALCRASGARCDPADAVAFDCAPFACEPIFGACRTRCSRSTECAGGFACDAEHGTCVALGRPAPAESGACSVALTRERGHAGGALLAGLLLGARRRWRGRARSGCVPPAAT